MNSQRHATLVAAASLCLTLTPLAGIFAGLSWTVPVLVTVAAISLAGSLIRGAGRGQGLQTLGMALALLVLMTAVFNGGTAIAFVIPTGGTFEHWADLVSGGVGDIITMAPPVEAEGGILFLTMLGVGTVAILHDMFIVGLRTPALSGLTLLTMYLVPVSVAPEATAWFWFILPAIAYLWILGDDNLRRVSRFGHRFTGSGRLVGPRFPSPLATTARVSGAVFVTITLVLLAVIPTNTSGLVDQVSQGYGEGDGRGDGAIGSLDPWAQLEGSLNRPDPVTVARVTTDDSTPRYLRMHVADVLTNDGFQPSEDRELDSLAGLEYTGGDVYTATVENVALVDEVLPYYGRPISIDVDGDWALERDTSVITAIDTSLESVDGYSFEYTDPQWDNDDLVAAGSVSPDDPVLDLNTDHPDVPELTDLVDELVQGAESDFDKVLAIGDYLSPSNGFSYSLETVDAGHDEAILNFLDSQVGFCQQYSAAMGWMLREADVPARVALGLTRGTLVDDEWVITSNNFHSWVEVYFEGIGWVPFDPTPSAGVANSVAFPWAADPADQTSPDDEPTADSTQEADAANPDRTTEPTGPVADPTDQAAAGPQGPGGGTPSGFNPAWLLLILAAAVPFVPALWRSGLRRSRLGPKRLSAQSAWEETRGLALDYGVSLEDSLTPRQAGVHLGKAAPGAADAATAVASALEYHRYSRRGADTTTLPAAVRDLRSAFDKAASPAVRVQARLWPASLAAMLAERSERSDRSSGLRGKVRWPRRSNGRGDAPAAPRV